MTTRPYPLQGDSISDGLAISFRISTPDGLWLELNEGSTFQLADGSFEEEQTTLRRQTVDSPFMEGTFVVTALRENVTETVKVWVRGDTHFDFANAVSKLKAALLQPQFTAEKVVSNARWTWNCYASDHALSTSRPFLHARMGQLSIQLLRDPVEYLAEDI